MQRTNAVIVAVVTALGAGTGLAGAEVRTFAAAADATMFQSGVAPGQLLSSGVGDGVFAGRTLFHAEYRQRGLIRFDLSGIPCGSLIQRVTLKMYMERAASAQLPTEVRLHRLAIAGSWAEGGSASFGGAGMPSEPGDVNWQERQHPGILWVTPGGDFSPITSASATVTIERKFVTWGTTAEMAGDVAGWVNDPVSNNGWLLLGDEVTQGTARKFSSRESLTVGQRPVLLVEFAPPCSLADIAGSGNCGDGIVDGDDFIAFINSFSVGDPTIDARADVAGGGAAGLSPDGIIDGNDFVAFVNAFAAGC